MISMSKERFTRTNVHDTKMKKIILRLDYAGVMNTNDLVKAFDSKFPKYFKVRNLILNREVNVTLHKSDLEEVGKTLSLPTNIIEKSPVTRYIDFRQKEVACNVVLDIGQYYMCMVITCHDNYDGLDNYIEVFKGAVSVFKSKIDYFQPKRLGLRKFREEANSAIEEVKKPFESFICPINPYGINNFTTLNSEYIDSIMSEDKKLKFNIHSRIKLSKDEDKRDIYVSLLDLDAYCDNEELLSGDINALLTEANQKEFDIYKSCMKETYLTSISR